MNRSAIILLTAALGLQVSAQIPLENGSDTVSKNAPSAPGTAAPASDLEETGAMTDILPGRVEPLTLPAEPGEGDLSPEEIAVRDAASLFPGELWPASLPEREMVVGGEGGESERVPGSGGLTPEVIADCFGPAAPPALHDPQGLLDPSTAAPLREMLREVLNVTERFPISVVVLGPGQSIPVAINPPELLSRWYGDRRALLVLYFLGEPERTQAFFSPETRRYHHAADLRQVIEFGVREAARMGPAAAQLERFCYKTAIRLERLWHQGPLPASGMAAESSQSAPGTALWWAFAVGVQAAGVAGGTAWWWRRRRMGFARRRNDPVSFPEQDLIGRLGAPHSGGGGIAISFDAAPAERSGWKLWKAKFDTQGG